MIVEPPGDPVINKGLSFQEVLGVLDETEECTMKKEKLKTKYFKKI